MANTKVSALTADGSFTGTESFLVNDAGATKSCLGSHLIPCCGVVRTVLASPFVNDVHTSLVKVTGLDTATGVYTVVFEYHLCYQSDTAASGLNIALNHTGTVTSFVAHSRLVELSTGTAAGAASQVVTTFGMVSGGSSRAKSATVAMTATASVDTLNADMLLIVEGLLVCTVAGNLQIYASPETSAGILTIKTGSSLVLTQV